MGIHTANDLHALVSKCLTMVHLNLNFTTIGSTQYQIHDCLLNESTENHPY